MKNKKGPTTRNKINFMLLMAKTKTERVGNKEITGYKKNIAEFAF